MWREKSVFTDELRINSTLLLLYNVFDSQRAVYEKQKADPHNKFFLFFFFSSFPPRPTSHFGAQLVCISESERCNVLKHELILL